MPPAVALTIPLVRVREYKAGRSNCFTDFKTTRPPEINPREITVGEIEVSPEIHYLVDFLFGGLTCARTSPDASDLHIARGDPDSRQIRCESLNTEIVLFRPAPD